MLLSKIIKSAACVALAALMLFSAASCRNKKTVSTSATPTFGHFTEKGYELPYEYSDGYKAAMKVPLNSSFLNVSTTPTGNKVVHMTCEQSVDAVKKFYDAYFKDLVKLKAVKETDKSVAYYDKDARLVLFNLTVWVANNMTNFSLGTQACDKLEDSTQWKKADDSSKSEKSESSEKKTESSKDKESPDKSESGK